MVTSQKILEKGMGNRGSKSLVFVRKLYTVVKEHRVDGSCNGLVINPLDLQTEMVHSLFLPLKRNQVQVEKFILHLLLAYFNAGKIYKSKRGIIYYTIGSTKDLLKHVLPHFEKYPLSSLKLKDYLVFKRILLLMQKGEHQSLSGLFKIFSERANLNKGLKHLSLFLSIQVKIEKEDMHLSQHAKDLDLLKRIADSLECGIKFRTIYYRRFNILFIRRIKLMFILLGTIIFTIGFLFKGTPKASGTKPYMKMYEWLN
ncbi:unnamed protein product [Fusarium graminearum]|nr:unnamed protein product [Fusarium graminearum]